MKPNIRGCHQGSLEIAQLLLERGGDVNTNLENEHTALHCLCHSYKQDSASVYNDMLDLFIAHGSNINAQYVLVHHLKYWITYEKQLFFFF